MAIFKDIFNDLSDKLTKSGEIETLSSTFAQQTTDFSRIEFACSIPLVRDGIKSQKKFKSKCSKEAEKLRSEGNRYFKGSEYVTALNCYTKSIMFAPDNSPELGLALANRSAVLFRLKRYLDCLTDTRHSLGSNYPDDLEYKLLQRQGKCFVKLGKNKLAIRAFEMAKTSVKSSILREENRVKLIKEIDAELSNLKEKISFPIKDDIGSTNHRIVIPRILNQSPVFPCASDAFTVIYDNFKGRYPVAGRDIAIGEIIAVEEPYSSVLFPLYYTTHCHHCMTRVYNGMPCGECSGVIFCSDSCRDNAWDSYHHIECQYLQYLEDLNIGMSVLALRVVIETGLTKITQHDTDQLTTLVSDNLHRGFSSDRVYRSHDYHAAFSLVNHSTDRTVADIFRRTIQAVLLLDILKESSFFASLETTTDDPSLIYTQIGSHLLRHIMMLPCNAHEITEYTHTQDIVFDNTEIGSALYNTLSLINHSCDPSVVRNSYSNVCVVRAIRGIQKGEEICDNYGTLYATANYTSRHDHLLKQYYFNCMCEPCIENWGEFFDLPDSDIVYKCVNCGGKLEGVKGGVNRCEFVCEGCDDTCDLTGVIGELDASEQRYPAVLEEVVKGNRVSGHLEFLVGYLSVLDKYVVRPWKQYNKVQETIKQIYSTMGNVNGPVDQVK